MDINDEIGKELTKLSNELLGWVDPKDPREVVSGGPRSVEVGVDLEELLTGETIEMDIGGLVLGRWISYSFKVDKGVVKHLISDEHPKGDDIADILDFDSVASFEASGLSRAYITLLNEFPEACESVKGGRLDIILRTPIDVLQDMDEYRFQNQRRTVFEQMIDLLKNIDGSDGELEGVFKLNSLSEALDMLK